MEESMELAWATKNPCFFWLLLNNGVLVNEERERRCMSSTAACSMCSGGDESVLHMLRDCGDAKRTWEGLMQYGGEKDFFDVSLNWTDWVIRNISSKVLLGSGVKWCTVFGVGCWQLWKKRCRFIFNGERVCPEGMVARIISMVKMVEETRMATDRCSGVTRSPILVGWRPPATDTLKLNTDASLEGGSGRAYGGGLFRDATGSWRYGFVVNIGLCSILLAELWCLLHGLRLAKALGFRKLEVESDSFTGISMIKGDFEVSINCRSIVQGVRDLLPDFDSVVVNHLHREGNFAADFLSHHAYSFPRGVHVLESPPIGLGIWMLHDRLGISYTR